MILTSRRQAMSPGSSLRLLSLSTRILEKAQIGMVIVEFAVVLNIHV
jgi:hypothetical protein